MDDFAALRAWDRFLDVQGRSERTRRLYRYTLIRVMADTLTPLLEMDEDAVVDYLADLPPRGHARKDATQALRSFFGWAEERGLCRSPVRRIRARPSRYASPAPSLTADEEERVAAAAGSRHPRRSAAIRLAYATGARVGSLVAIRPEDVHLDGEHSWVDLVQAKNDRPYRVPLGPMGHQAAGELLALWEGGSTLLGVGRAAVEGWVRDAGKPPASLVGATP